MKTSPSVTFRLWQRLLLVLLAGSMIATAAPQTGGGRKSLDLKITNDGQTAKVTVPEGVATVTLQRFRREDGWSRVVVKNAVPGVMRFKLPTTGKNARWRAIGKYETAVASRDKFPAAFYQGTSGFHPDKASTGGIRVMGRVDGLVESGAANDSPVEADIWKVDGNTVYFFNQLRGLQVLDLADPADPHITASLRLPAEGQDLYLLPGGGAVRRLVLLTQGWSNKDGDWTRINLIKVSGGQAEITHTRSVPGYLADSRMVGSRLILATTEWNQSNDATDGTWSARSHLTEWQISPGNAPQPAGETVIEGDDPLIAAGPDWLALAVHPNGQWDVSEISVFALRPAGLVRMGAPVRTEGSVESKFAMQWTDNVLTTISERNTRANGWSPVTVLENFRAWAPEVVHTLMLEGRLGRLRLAKGESLFATRFAGDKAYIVTFLQTDPLFIVDLSDPADPKIAGQIEVPGYSTHLEPLGDLLLAIGWESNTAVASLFDVANPASPQLLRRLKLGASGTYSEALWDEKALKLLPGTGLAMIPLTSYDKATGDSRSVVQLIDVDTTARNLRLRGSISHEFDARRADLIGSAVVSISQRVMVAADVTNRDAPSILSEVSLAWPVDRVFESGGYLIQIEDGSAYGGGRATARISPAGSTEQILAEFDLGKGTVKAADLRDGKLHILRETAASFPFYYYRPTVAGNGTNNKLVLDIYDATALPALTLLGTSSVRPPEGGHVGNDKLLWPQPNRPAVVIDTSAPIWFGGIFFKSTEVDSLATAAAPIRTASLVKTDFRPYWVPEKSPRLLVFDTTDPANPQAGDPVVLGPDGVGFNGYAEAAGGLVVMGNSQWKNPSNGDWFTYGLALHTARVVEVESAGTPIIRPLIDLPGELFAVTELDHDGFLAFTRTDGTATTFHVSACDGYDAFQIAILKADGYAVATAGGRRLFVATKGGVQPYRLTADGSLVTESTIDTGWTPYSLRWVDGILLGGKWDALFSFGNDGLAKWKFPTWNPGVERIVPAANGDLLVPFGEYGVDRLAR